MNYLKQLWQQFYLNDDSCSCQEDQEEKDNSPQQSGEFQVIQMEEDAIMGGNLQESRNTEEKEFSPTYQVVNDGNKKQDRKNHLSLEQQQAIKEKLTANYMIIDFNLLSPSEKFTQQQAVVKGPHCLTQKQKQKTHSASTIQMDEYYMIVDSEELSQTFKSEEEWEEFYQRINEYNKDQVKSLGDGNNCQQELLGCEKLIAKKPQNGSKKEKVSLTFKDLNSILEITPGYFHRRHSYWSTIAQPLIEIRFKYTQLANKKDPKRLQQNVDRIMESLVPSILYEIADKKYKQIENIEDELQKWRMCMIKVLTLYGANDRQIGYSKGLEYLVVGLMVSIVILLSNQQQANCPQISTSTIEQQHHRSFYSQIETHFKYLMFTKNLRNMYFPGTPKLYPEIQCLTELMHAQIPKIYQMLQDMKVEFIKLFINYYKTFLMYKLKNPQVIRKIMELLIIYGLDLVRIVVIRILARQEKIILEKKNKQDEGSVLKYIAEQLVIDYFRNAEANQVKDKFKNLFVLETGL